MKVLISKVNSSGPIHTCKSFLVSGEIADIMCGSLSSTSRATPPQMESLQNNFTEDENLQKKIISWECSKMFLILSSPYSHTLMFPGLYPILKTVC